MGRWRIDRIAGPPVLLVEGAGRVVADRCHVARGPVARAVGLLGTPDPAAGEALWLSRCGAVHTVGMRRRIDVAAVDRDGRVLAVAASVGPFRLVRRRGAVAMVETPAGGLAGIAAGDRLRLVATPAEQLFPARSADRPRAGAGEGGDHRRPRGLTMHSGRGAPGEHGRRS